MCILVVAVGCHPSLPFVRASVAGAASQKLSLLKMMVNLLTVLRHVASKEGTGSIQPGNGKGTESVSWDGSSHRLTVHARY